MYDVKPGSEDIPELAAHMAARRARTLDAITRGLEPHFLGADLTAVSASVLASLEQMWRDDEVFT